MVVGFLRGAVRAVKCRGNAVMWDDAGCGWLWATAGLVWGPGSGAVTGAQLAWLGQSLGPRSAPWGRRWGPTCSRMRAIINHMAALGEI